MAKPGSGKSAMTAVRRKRQAATSASLHKTGATMKSGFRSWKRQTKKMFGGAKGGGSAPAKAKRQAAPLSPAAAKVRKIGIAVIVLGFLVSAVVPPLGAVVALAGLVGALCARGLAARFGGEDGSDGV